MAALDAAIHAAPPQRRVLAAPRMVARALGTKLLTLPPPCGRSLRGNTWLAGTNPAMTLGAPETSSALFLAFWTAHAVSTRNFKKPPGAKPIEVSFKAGGAESPDAAGDVR